MQDFHTFDTKSGEPAPINLGIIRAILPSGTPNCVRLVLEGGAKETVQWPDGTASLLKLVRSYTLTYRRVEHKGSELPSLVDPKDEAVARIVSNGVAAAAMESEP